MVAITGYEYDARLLEAHKRLVMIRLEWARENRDTIKEIQALYEILWMRGRQEHTK